MQRMPEIWDDKRFLTTYTTVLGSLANYAIQQSSDLIPDNLAAALREFDTIFKSSTVEEMRDTGVIATSYRKLIHDVKMCLGMCPLILAWNVPRESKPPVKPYYGYNPPEPGSKNFVDLDALAMNIAKAVTLVEKYDNEYGAGMSGINEAYSLRMA